ncbi:TonB-dependent siderophore receptor [Pigmentiphaga aceris]|uniref:TonB-dependent siderophore receptor n=1 Tax=Pigmentiphaga aceris TaxID=1940612 RepID=A0A5C0AZK1_9BURK|nr:TonB-dependent receptor [Pigmentiphaga aceris]QEI07892.1 TonB-dependent siderophore receptor [Pigmentiphaga aceris]
MRYPQSTRFHPAPLALAIALALSVPALAHAQAITDARPIALSIAAQPLGDALNELGAALGMSSVAFSHVLVAGKTAPAIQGSMTARQALDRLLAGTGLVGTISNGVLTVQQAPQTGPATLAPVTVTAPVGHDDATEGTGSYVAQSSTVGSKMGLSLREVPQSVSVVTRQQIEDLGLTTLPDALKAMPGVTGFQGAMLTDRALARGFEVGMTNMRVDGGAGVDRGYGIDNDMAFYDRVEVLRGADGLFGGNGEPGGVINLVRKRPTRETQTIVQAQYGSYNFKRADIDVSGPLTEDGRIRGRAVLAREDKRFFFDVAESERTLAYGILEADLTPDTTVTLGASYVKRDSSVQGYGLPRASTGEDLRLPHTIFLSGANDHADKSIKTVFGQVAHRFNEDWRLDLAVNHERATQDRYDHYFFGAPNLNTGYGTYSNGTNLQNETWQNSSLDASLKGRFGLLGRQHDVILGADWSRFKLDTDFLRHEPYVTARIPNIYAFDPYDYRQPSSPMTMYRRYSLPQQQAGIYGSVRFHVTDPLHLIAGGRLSRYHYRFEFNSVNASGTPTSTSITDYRDENVFTPYLAATYDLNQTWTAYASLAETFKSQASSLAGPEPGRPLDPITGRNYEVGVKGSHLGGRLQSAFAFYRINREGEAVRDPNYRASNGPMGSSCCYLGTGQVVSEGFDAELSGEPLRDLHVSLSYSYNDNRNENAAGQPRFNGLNPEHLVKAFASYRLQGSLSRWKLGGGITAQSKTFVNDFAYVRNGDGTVSNQTAPYRFIQRGYILASAHLDYTINSRWTASLNVNNLFDKRYYSTIGTLDYGSFYGTPRTAMLTLRGRF